jgi:hypothetical protein
MNNSEICPICQEPLNWTNYINLPNCGHRYHPQCLLMLIQSKEKSFIECSYCRDESPAEDIEIILNQIKFHNQVRKNKRKREEINIMKIENEIKLNLNNEQDEEIRKLQITNKKRLT